MKRAVMLSGPRRVGKSVILQQVAEALREAGEPPASILYASFDIPLLKIGGLRRVLEVYHRSVHPTGHRAWVLLDEIHYSQEWDFEIKALVDHHPEYRILATGSSSLVVREESIESGVGRWISVHIPTLSFFEFLRIRDDQAPDVAGVRPSSLVNRTPRDLMGLAQRARPLMPLFERYLLVGGFPETALMKDLGTAQRVLREDIVDRVLKRDMTTLFRVRNVADLERLFLYLCYHSGGQLNVTACSKELGVSRPTIQGHLDLLEKSNLVYRLPLDAQGCKKLLKSSPKYYIVDAALRNAVLLRGAEVLKDAVELSRIVETTVLRHLYAFHYAERPRLSYWHDDSKARREVDVVVRGGAYTIAVEVKYRERAELMPEDGLSLFVRNERPTSAFLVTRAEHDCSVETLDHGARVARVPAHLFTLLLGATDSGG